MDINKRRGGFTLAEVLITLSIIGVVAALTIPSLIVKNQEKQTVVQLKKAFNVFSNAFSLAKIEYGDPSGWGWGNSVGEKIGALNGMNKLAPFLNIIQKCDNTKGCFPANKIYDSTNIFYDFTDRPKALLADGMPFYIYNEGTGCSNNFGQGALSQVCASIHIDVNGAKGPNKHGKDMFMFWISTQGIIPTGTPLETKYPLNSYCQENKTYGCTAWVILKENMDYPPAGVGWGETTTTP